MVWDREMQFSRVPYTNDGQKPSAAQMQADEQPVGQQWQRWGGMSRVGDNCMGARVPRCSETGKHCAGWIKGKVS